VLTGRRAAALATLLWAGFAHTPALAQASGQPCVLDKCLNAAGVPPPPLQRSFGGPRAPGHFDFYVLALSWSPGFCDTAGSAKGGEQCAPGAGLGFVVHGLWPQNQHGYPSDCDTTARPGRAALELTRGLYPSAGLAIHEWRKHGSCTGLSPNEYFATVRRAREAVTIPPALEHPTEPQTVAPLELARAFATANPGLRTDMMAVTCRQDELAEVRLCFTKDLRGFTTCPEIARGACRTRSISVLPVQ
jgi:ribonuclease T2